MKIDASMLTRNPGDAIALAKRLEDAGFDGVCTFEGPHDPFMPLVTAATNTSKVDLLTTIAVAFARNPMTVANTAYDLQLLSEGRFILGLGPQIKPHIEKRYSMHWGKPIGRMREFVAALHAIWDSWETGERLDFRGEYYTHTIMGPAFNPGPNPHGKPKVFLAGFGEKTVGMVGEIADGFLIHPVNSRKFLEEYSLPALKTGLDKSGRSIEQCETWCQVITCMGNTPEQIEQNKVWTFRQLAFYMSTPAYKPALDVHGWGDDIQPVLNKMSKEGKWEQMGDIITDEVFRTYVAIGTPEEVADQIIGRCDGLVDRVSPADYSSNVDLQIQLLKALKNKLG